LQPTREGFSLVELLVVISILVLIVALALPAITKSIEAADRNSCAANQTKLALGMASYDTRNGYLPGLRNKLDILSPGTAGGLELRLTTAKGPGEQFFYPGHFKPMPTSTPSWFIVLLPHLGRDDVFKAVVGGEVFRFPTNYRTNQRVQEMTTCPARKDSAIANANYEMHYKANGGRIGGGGAFNKNDGAIGDNANGVFASLADITSGDGVSRTLLIAEGSQEPWQPLTVTDGAASGDWGYFPGIQGHNGSFRVAPDPGNTLRFGLPDNDGTFLGSLGATSQIINYDGNRNAPKPLLPSSVHPGGAMVAFADGSSRFLKDDLPVYVYGHLVTSRSIWDRSTNTYVSNSTAANRYLKCPPASSTSPSPIQSEDY
jgi:prepilin-type N-terminal cleavage/methylation domain-containing protein/prepilin-type processing-associated H-X9-DG protein